MNRNFKTGVMAAFILAATLPSCRQDFLPDFIHGKKHEQAKDNLSNSVVLDWNNTAYDAAGGASEGNPLLASRSNTMMHIAIHDALNAITPFYEQYAFHQKIASADPFAATVSAAHTVLVALWPDQVAMLDAKRSESLSNIANGAAKTAGIELGVKAAKAILDARASDGAYQNPVADVPVSTTPGVYNAVPPQSFLFAQFWKTMQPFSIKSYDQFRSVPPPALNSGKYAHDFNEIKEVGKRNSATRTADQSAYATFWYEFADIGWNRIARQQAEKQQPGLYATARMFALLNMAITDAYTAGWDAKYHYYFWRPYTAIRAAETDGNSNTEADKAWEPAEVTPPVPEYPGTHSAIGHASATVLNSFFGNHTSFSTTSTTSLPAGSVRNFESFKTAANENADSRVMAGIHFRFSCDAGEKQGNGIGKWTLNNHLKRVH